MVGSLLLQRWLELGSAGTSESDSGFRFFMPVLCKDLTFEHLVLGGGHQQAEGFRPKAEVRHWA